MDTLAVDTNVFVHASRPDESLFGNSVAFLRMLKESSLAIIVDPGFSLQETTNTSLIGSEYLKHIMVQPPGSFGKEALIALVIAGRLKPESLTVPAAMHKRILAFIKGSKPRDRTFLKLACVSSRRELVTHDFEDFSIRKRKDIKRQLAVLVCTGSEWPGP